MESANPKEPVQVKLTHRIRRQADGLENRCPLLTLTNQEQTSGSSDPPQLGRIAATSD